MYESILQGLAQSASGSDYSSTHKPISGAPVHVAPIGINLGEILMPMNEGNPQTGGYGIDLISRLGYGKTSQIAKRKGFQPVSYGRQLQPNSIPIKAWLIGGVALIGGAFLLMKKRR